MKNYGLVLEPIVIEKDYLLGGFGSIGGTILQPDGQWDMYLPPDEFQNLNGVEPCACTSFGTLNALEILFRRLFGLPKNYSDRFLAKASGTIIPGNSPHKVAETIRKVGLVTQEAWPFDSLINTFDKFYAEVPRSVYALATAFSEEFDFKHEYVPCTPEGLKEALKYSPLGMSVYGWYQDLDHNSPTFGLYTKPQGAEDNHWICVYGFEDGKYWKVFDSYDSTHKKVAWTAMPLQAKRYFVAKQPFPVANPTWWRVFIKWVNQFTGLTYGRI